VSTTRLATWLASGSGTPSHSRASTARAEVARTRFFGLASAAGSMSARMMWHLVRRKNRRNGLHRSRCQSPRRWHEPENRPAARRCRRAASHSWRHRADPVRREVPWRRMGGGAGGRWRVPVWDAGGDAGWLGPRKAAISCRSRERMGGVSSVSGRRRERLTGNQGLAFGHEIVECCLQCSPLRRVEQGVPGAAHWSSSGGIGRGDGCLVWRG
jgi:hypothetical protein